MSVVEPGGSADVPEIPDGLYQATVKAVKDITLEQPDNFGNTEKVEIDIAFVDSDGVAQTLQPRVNRKWGEKANLFIIANACGIEADPDQPFDTDELTNKKVNVLIETPEEGKWPRVKAWSRIRQKAAPRASQTVSGPPNTPAMIIATGEVDWTAFWRAIDGAGVPRERVAGAVEGNLENLQTMEPTAVVDLFEILAGEAVTV